jgi:hypothetical protein
MPEGTCMKCGLKYAGWALNQPVHLTCKCGGKIKVWSVNPPLYGSGMIPYATKQGAVAL